MNCRRLLRLPKRHDKYGSLMCSGWKCRKPVEYIASYPWDGTTADRLYCERHAARFSKRWGVKPK